MVKFPKEVANIIRILHQEKFEAFAAGRCVRDAYLGEKPLDWDISTDASLDDLIRLFPDASVIDRTAGAVRMSFMEEITDEEGNVIDEDGIVVDVSGFRAYETNKAGILSGNLVKASSIEEDLSRFAFTVDAMADSGMKVADPYDGKSDAAKKLLRTIADPDECFTARPICMMEAVSVCASFGFDLTRPVFESIVKNYRLLEKADMGEIRDEFTDIMSGAFAGKGLTLLIDTGIINIIMGDAAVRHMNRREKDDLMKLCEGIDRTKQIPDRRLGLFFIIFRKQDALKAIERLYFDNDTNQHLVDACYDMARLYFTNNKEDIKRFVYDHGTERYEYLSNLEKAQRIAMELDNQLKIEGRLHFYNEAIYKNEPIFTEDLVIDANDLIEEQICTRENAENMLKMLVEYAHIYPEINTREKLLTKAKKFKKNKLAAATRGVKWLH